jgi:hypothetical protein
VRELNVRRMVGAIRQLDDASARARFYGRQSLRAPDGCIGSKVC